MNIIREWKVVMAKRKSRGPIIDPLMEKLDKLRCNEVKVLSDNKISDDQKAWSQAMIQQERAKVMKQIRRVMLMEQLQKNGKTPEELHIKI